MKKYGALLVFIALCSTRLLCGPQKVHNIAVKPQQLDQLAAMVKVLKFQTKRHCDLCETGKNPRFMNMTPQEFEYRFNKSAQELEGTINTIVNFYRSIGVNQTIIDEEARVMRANVYALKKQA